MTHTGANFEMTMSVKYDLKKKKYFFKENYHVSISSNNLCFVIELPFYINQEISLTINPFIVQNLYIQGLEIQSQLFVVWLCFMHFAKNRYFVHTWPKFQVTNWAWTSFSWNAWKTNSFCHVPGGLAFEKGIGFQIMNSMWWNWNGKIRFSPFKNILNPYFVNC